MATKLPKRLGKAPLLYVLAQVLINPYEKLAEKFLADIQEALREGGYPNYRVSETQTYQIAPTSAPAKLSVAHRYDFADKANTSGVSLTKNSFFYHTTAYTKFPDFINNFRACLTLVDEILGIDIYTRMGLRYIDLIESNDGKDLSDYLVPGIQGFTPGGYEVTDTKTQTETLSVTKPGRLVQRLTLGTMKSALPEELKPFQLTLDRELSDHQPKALLDIALYSGHEAQALPKEFSIDAIIEDLEAKHVVTREAFRASVTDEAIKLWQ